MERANVIGEYSHQYFVCTISVVVAEVVAWMPGDGQIK